MFGIFLAEDTCFRRNLPVDSEVGVAQEQPSVRLGMVEIVAFVGEDRFLAEDGETVCKPPRDIELAVVLFAQFDTEPLAEGRALFAQVHRYVQHFSYGATDQFRLGIRRALEMQTSYNAVGGAGLIVLYERGINPRRAVALLVIRLHEISACVVENLRLDHQEPFDWSLNNIHEISYDFTIYDV